MQTLLLISVVLTGLAIITQAGVLVAMYLMSRRVASKAETLMADAQRLMTPLESITSDLKTVSNDLAETGKMARQQVLNVQDMVNETRDNIRGQMFEVRERIIDTVDEARDVVMRPIRHYSAIATGIAEGFRTFFSGRRKPPSAEEVVGVVEEERTHPA